MLRKGTVIVSKCSTPLEMKIIHILLICILIYGSGCTKTVDRPTLQRMLKSDDKSQIIEAINYISNNKDTLMIKDLLKNSFDPRITHLIKYKGMSIYQLKMGAMKNIMGIAPPNKITYKPDSANVNFYVEIAIKRGWFK